MAYMDEINTLLTDNGTGDITADYLRQCFSLIDTNVGKLVKISEGANTGYRIYDLSYDYQGNIGQNAVDLSIQSTLSNANGAMGDYSFCTGLGTRTEISASIFGKYNIGKADTIFEIGNGVNDTTRSNIFEIFTNGLVTANADYLDIDAGDLKTLVTKEYLSYVNVNPIVIEETENTYYTPNLLISKYFEYTITQDSVINNPSSMRKGLSGHLVLKINETGNWNITFGSDWVFVNGTPTINVDSNIINVFTYVVVDTNKILVNSIADL